MEVVLLLLIFYNNILVKPLLAKHVPLNIVYDNAFVLDYILGFHASSSTLEGIVVSCTHSADLKFLN